MNGMTLAEEATALENASRLRNEADEKSKRLHHPMDYGPDGITRTIDSQSDIRYRSDNEKPQAITENLTGMLDYGEDSLRKANQDLIAEPIESLDQHKQKLTDAANADDHVEFRRLIHMHLARKGGTSENVENVRKAMSKIQPNTDEGLNLMLDMIDMMGGY